MAPLVDINMNSEMSFLIINYAFNIYVLDFREVG